MRLPEAIVRRAGDQRQVSQGQRSAQLGVGPDAVGTARVEQLPARVGECLDTGAPFDVIVDYCFDVMKLHRIEIAIRPENTKSLRVVAKLGFRPEGLRPRYLHIDGDWRDHLVFALNAEEVPEGLVRRWENLRPRQPR